MSYENITYTDHTVYLILSHLPEQDNYHVGIYVSLNGETGLIYHAHGCAGDFEYEAVMSEVIQHSNEIRLALVIGRICDETQLDRLDQQVMPNIPVRNEDPTFNCWTWIRQALVQLRSEGMLSFSCIAEDIEDEARMLVKGIESRGLMGNERVKVSRLCH